MTSALARAGAPADRRRPTGGTQGTPTRRLESLDALRGLAIFLMLLVDNPGVRAQAPLQLQHAPWNGLRLADLVFPAFLFAVGVSMPFSRRATAARSVLQRVALLFAIGVGLNSAKYGQLVLAGVLQHIAGSYLLAWAVLRLRIRHQVAACAGLLAAVWAAYTFLRAPGLAAGTWSSHGVGGWVDRQVYGSFETEGVPAMLLGSVNVVCGAVVGRLVLHAANARAVARRLALWGLTLVGLGALLAIAIPVNKHLWTPSYAVLTSGVAALALLPIYLLTDALGQRVWSRPLVHLGTNALAIFIFSQLLTLFVLPHVRDTVVTPLADAVGATVASVAYSVTVALLSYLLARVLYRRRIVLKV